MTYNCGSPNIRGQFYKKTEYCFEQGTNCNNILPTNNLAQVRGVSKSINEQEKQ